MFDAFNVGNGPVQFNQLVEAPSPPDYRAPNGLGAVFGSSKASFGMPKSIKIGLPVALAGLTVREIYRNPMNWKWWSSGLILTGAMSLAAIQS